MKETIATVSSQLCRYAVGEGVGGAQHRFSTRLQEATETLKKLRVLKLDKINMFNAAHKKLFYKDNFIYPI